MKIALCIYGYVGKRFKFLDGDLNHVMCIEEGEYYIKNNVISKYDVDIFIHSFDYKRKDEIINVYSPKYQIIEPQISNFLINHEDYIGKGYNGWERKSTIFNYQSAKYSRKQSVLLKKKFEEENNFIYDWVFISRFDMAYLKKFEYEKLNNNLIYTAGTKENSINRNKIHDIYFLSNSNNINIISEFYDNMYECGLNPKLPNYSENIHDVEAFYFKKVNLWDKVEPMYNSLNNWGGDIRNLRYKPDVKTKYI